MELQDYRRQYTKGGLREVSMPSDPLVLFEQWQRDASAAGVADPTGVVVATVQPDGSIRQRFVLLKGVSECGFILFTNYNSDKAAALSSCASPCPVVVGTLYSRAPRQLSAGNMGAPTRQG